ncbi:MAG: hypothetical protein WCJ13_01610 [Coriobacteriia bacterium]
MLYELASAGIILGLFCIALVSTLIVELVVAVLFSLGTRGLGAVALVNLLMNPLYNFAFLAVIYTFGLGGESFSVVDWRWLVGVTTIILETVVVVVEWRLLFWVTQGTAGSSRRLLVFSVVANLVSAVAPFAVLSLGYMNAAGSWF